MSSITGLNLEDDGRAIGCSDWDGDGDIDLWVTNRNAPQLRLLRNDLPEANRSVSVYLQGQTSNRDGIGARVELAVDGRRLTKTLRAGEGYLAQSSKWLHFGLGDVDEVRSVAVVWPGAKREVFSGVEAGRRYLLVQGTGLAELREIARDLPEGDTIDSPPKPKPDETARTFLVSRLPMPRLVFETLNGTPSEVWDPTKKQPVLLNLWASWCKPCLAELNDFSERANDIRTAGLDIVSLSVDGLDPDTDSTGSIEANSRQLRSLLERTGFPFRAGRADARLVEQLQLWNNYLFDLHLPLPLPTSILMDQDGKMAAIYKGPVAVDQLIRDVTALTLETGEQRDYGGHFPGRWLEPVRVPSLVPLLDRLVKNGFLKEADDFVRRMGDADPSELLPAITRLGMACYKQGWNDVAQKHFQVALRIDPTYAGVETELAHFYEQQGEFALAERTYRKALQRDARSVRTLNNLAWLLATCPKPAVRDGSDALTFAKQAVDLTGNADPSILDTMAAALAESKEFESAMATVERATKIAEAQGRLSLVKAMQRRREMYRRSQPYRTVD